MIVPEKNRRDIKELDKEITKDMKFVYASTMADILPVALESYAEGTGSKQFKVLAGEEEWL